VEVVTWEEEAEDIGGESGVSSAMKSSEQRIRSAYVIFWEVEMVLLDGSSIVPFGAFISREISGEDEGIRHATYILNLPSIFLPTSQMYLQRSW
jgi:hypothetical protein